MSNSIKTARKGGVEVYKLIMIVVFAVCLLLPIGAMIFGLESKDFVKVFSAHDIGKVISNSVVVSLTATVITVVVAYFLAVAVERTTIKGKAIFSVIMLMPMLVPSISHGTGLVMLFGNNGIITKTFGLSSNIYGFWGIVAGSFLYSCPVAFIMLRDIMRYENGLPYEAAAIMGIPKWRRFMSITLPFLRKPLISVVFSVFTMVITDYGVPVTVGGKYKTVAAVMYQDVIGQVDFGKGTVYGILLLVPAVLAFVIDFLNKDKGNMGYVTTPVAPSKGVVSQIAAYGICSAASIFILMPIASFLILGFSKRYPNDMSFSLNHFKNVFKSKGDTYLLNSVFIALAVAVVGVTIAFITAYFTARAKGGLSKVLHLISITAMAVPGIVLGLSYVIFYKGSAIYGTVIVLVMVNIIHFIASPYLMMYNSFAKINENLEEVGRTLGIKRMRMIKDVLLPQSISTLAEMFLYFFVNSMMTISAVSFLATASTKPISLMINQFNDLGKFGNVGVVSLLILVINLTLHGVIAFVKWRIKKAK